VSLENDSIFVFDYTVSQKKRGRFYFLYYSCGDSCCDVTMFTLIVFVRDFWIQIWQIWRPQLRWGKF